jgi:hypothetical protein
MRGALERIGADLRSNLWAGLRLALFRPVAAADFRAHPDQALLLVALAAAVRLVLGYLEAGHPASFDVSAVGPHSAQLLIFLLGLYLAARLCGEPSRVLLLLVVLPSSGWPFELVARLGALWEYWTWPAAAIVSVWALAVLFHALRVGLGGGSLRALGAAVLLLSASALPVYWLGRPDLWYATASLTGGEKAPEINVEDVFYAQPEQVRQALAGLAPQRPGVVDLYFVGFGGYAQQDVFMREVGHARELLDSRFDTAGRSLLLVNNVRGLERQPIASLSNLRRVLAGLGRMLDPDEDVLFLYLTSHGSREHELTVEFWPLRLNDIRPADLRAALDASGIRWRVVVVSACYAGGFVEALRDDATLVMAAAAPDRQSFGCAHENEYTYFGEALLTQALRETWSFREAFDRVARAVAERERREGKEQSRPVSHIGPAIEAHLRILEQRLAPPG